jgi:nitrogen regulatory protein PII
LIKCILRPEKLDDIVRALQPLSSGLTVWEVRGRGRQRAHAATYRGTRYELLLPKIMLEIAATNERVDEIVRVLMETARTGEIGDGRVLIHDVETVYHVRTGFMDCD